MGNGRGVENGIGQGWDRCGGWDKCGGWDETGVDVIGMGHVWGMEEVWKMGQVSGMVQVWEMVQVSDETGLGDGTGVRDETDVGDERCGDGTGVWMGQVSETKQVWGWEGRRGGACTACMGSGHSRRGWNLGKLPPIPGEVQRQ